MHRVALLKLDATNTRAKVIAPFVLLAALISIVFICILGVSDAGAVIGGGGSGSGGSGAHGKYGWGWYAYPVGGSPRPLGFRDGTTWASASGQCSVAGADKVMAFVLMNSSGDFAANDPGQGTVYEYYRTGLPGLGVNSNIGKDMSVYGRDWYSITDAKTLFDSLPASERAGWSWGGDVSARNVAWFCYSSSTHWGVTSYTGIKKSAVSTINSDSGWGTSDITALPGESLYWKHTLTAKDDRIDKALTWGLRGSGFPGSFNVAASGGTIPASSNIQNGSTFLRLGQYPGATSAYTVFTVSQGDVAKTFCQHVDWSPSSWNSGSSGGSSNEVCASVPYKYTLTPTAPGNLPESMEGGKTINEISGTVSNGGPTKSRDAIWQMTMYIGVQRGSQQNGTAPCGSATEGGYNGRNFGTPGDVLGSGGATCKSLARGSGVIDSGRSVTLSAAPYIDDLPVGTRVCFAVSVKSASDSSDLWSHSSTNCIVIAKKPKVQVLGGDLWVGTGSKLANIATSVTVGAARAPYKPPYNPSMISGLWQTGVSDSGAKLAPGQNDPHWQLTKVTNAKVGNSEYAHCQNFSTIRSAKVIDKNSVDVGGNEAWKASIPDAAWVGANTDATNDGIASDPDSDQSNTSTCPFPAMSNELNDATFNKAPIWTFKLTNGFNVDSCINPSTIKLSMRLMGDDEVRIKVNGVVVKDFRQDTPSYGTWPAWNGVSSMVVVDVGPGVGAFTTGKNDLEIDVKSAWNYTGLLVANGTVATAECNTVTPGNIFGSYAEYGIAASGGVSGMSSGAGYGERTVNGVKTKGVTSSNMCPLSILTFSNAKGAACSTAEIGKYTKLPSSLPSVAARFPVVKSGANQTPVLSGAVRLTDRSSGVYTANAGTLTLQNMTVGKGAWYVINAPDADVVINGNLQYTTDALANVNEIPQVVIIAKNIYVNEAATRVDAWLVASGSGADGVVNTCRAAGVNDVTGEGLNATRCRNQLTINGPVAANHIYLRRTFGAGVGDAAGVPGEVFNSRPDAYLWMSNIVTRINGSTRNVQLNVTSLRELPPRY